MLDTLQKSMVKSITNTSTILRGIIRADVNLPFSETDMTSIVNLSSGMFENSATKR